jgi:hypothetical protein
MKKTLLGILLLALSSSLYAQFGVVSAPMLESLMQVTHADQLLYYAQMIEQQIQAAQNTYNQYQNMIRAEQRALDNLKGIAGVGSLDDFMDWYNRQLYLDSQAENRLKNMGIKIGGETYRLADIDKIPEASSSRYLDYWNEEFSPEQRKEMWLNLGMTPANYMYVQAWKTKEKEVANIIFSNREVVNEENMAATERNEQILAEAMNEDVGEKGVLQAILEVMVDTNRAAREANYDTATFREWEYVRAQQQNAPSNDPVLSEMWGQDLFGPITTE